MGSFSDLLIGMKNVSEEIVELAESLDDRVLAGLPIQATLTSMFIRLKKLALMADLNMEAFHDNEYTVRVIWDWSPGEDGLDPIWDYVYPDLRTGPMAHYWTDRKDAERVKMAFASKEPKTHQAVHIYSVDFMGWQENNDEF